jgi:spermidine/putrescine transport system ATP-binding protein
MTNPPEPSHRPPALHPRAVADRPADDGPLPAAYPAAYPDVRLDHVSRRFGDVSAVTDLSLDIQPREFFSLLGPSGCGKTTTLRMIGGFDSPTEGTIYLGDRDVTRVPPYRRDVNTVFQSYALFPQSNVYDNLAFGLRRRKVPGAEVKRRVGEALELVRMEGMAKRRPNQLSGGQRQRVALARALINQPRVLLLDEPLGALDARLRKEMQSELKRIQSEVGITFVYVTHDQEEALTMADRIAVMRNGRIEQLGAPRTVYDRPATRFVAGFLGECNLLSGVLQRREDSYALVALQTGEVVSVPCTDERAGETVTVGVRPEKISMHHQPYDVPAGQNSITATVDLVSFVGVHFMYTVRRANGELCTVYVQNQGPEALPSAGDPVRLLWRPNYSFLLPPSDPSTVAASTTQLRPPFPQVDNI